ncbi:MAG: DUF2267 domain-containing protein [Armatimonadetes bacterium]|nr:DUF2267 domain-containing protein [Armatimonadota bacterium]
MQPEEFLKKVRQRSGLDTNEEARRAVDAVFGALRARISHGGGDNVADQLPKELRELWESGLVEHLMRSITGVERMDLHEFLARVQNAAHLANIDHAEAVTRAVFMTMREQITHGAQQAIANQLPEDIRAIWLASAPEAGAPPSGLYGTERIGPAAASVYRTDDQIAEDVRELLETSDEIDEERIDVHVQQGKVTLRGVVRTSGEWEAAGRVAAQTLGAREIENELTVVEEL